ncbi:hypothetical protein FHW16_001064 [Phyllobacterium myrsinacearum]|uniref:Lipoprotein n=1 Tax=Phyllobacterium myrsinacearum TaxID=28101 RepID=A0A839EEM4_9HYPH|nr:hypothetical protein [Phyllobacterium myrsinacearum]
MKFRTICLLLCTMMIATACGSDQRLKHPCSPGLFSFASATLDCGPLRPVNEALVALFEFGT